MKKPRRAPLSRVTSRARLRFESAGPAKPKFVPAGPFKLDRTNTFRVVFVAFPAGSTLTKLTLTSRADPRIVISFPPSPSDAIFAIVCNQEGGDPIFASGLVVGITDLEDPRQEASYDLALSGQLADGTPWIVDPEVINMPGG